MNQRSALDVEHTPPLTPTQTVHSQHATNDGKFSLLEVQQLHYYFTLDFCPG